MSKLALNSVLPIQSEHCEPAARRPVSDQVRRKPVAKEGSLKFGKIALGADQLRGDRRLCFSHFTIQYNSLFGSKHSTMFIALKSMFSHDAAHVISVMTS